MLKLPDLDEQIDLCALTGRLDRTYRYKGTICPKVALDGHIAIQHSGYTLIDLDLEDAQEYLKEAFRLKGERTSIPPPNAKLHDEFVLPTEGPVPRVIKALWISAVIIYAKCFAEAKGRRVKLEKSVIPAHMRACHDKIIKYRNTIVAHAGEGNLESALPELVIGPRPEPFYWIKSNVKRVEFVDDRNERVTFQDLVKAVHKHVIEKREQHVRRLLENVKKTPLDTWYARAILSPVDKIESA
ncbi:MULTISPECIES: hypothetical protein [Massilia]|uniref:Uncharacterized protein n=1 Tax=Massilia haematophila TaxID=457923 RepID=A0ABV7PN78_9BURK|nr:hypothetical protein [Massilia sp.]